MQLHAGSNARLAPERKTSTSNGQRPTPPPSSHPPRLCCFLGANTKSSSSDSPAIAARSTTRLLFLAHATHRLAQALLWSVQLPHTHPFDSLPSPSLSHEIPSLPDTQSTPHPLGGCGFECVALPAALLCPPEARRRCAAARSSEEQGALP